MSSGIKFIKATAFLGLVGLLTGGFIMHGSGSGVAAPGAGGAKGSDECYESIKGTTNLTRTENADSSYGYANVECSPTTGAVLWYGDPFYGTVPIEGMPELDDHTAGDFAKAVVKPRQLKSPMQCSMCHPAADRATQKNDPRQLGMHQDVVADSNNLQHGRGAIWCLDCHNVEDRNTLVDHRGTAISFDQSQMLCGSCHGDIYSEWRMGLHGKRTGSWEVGGKKRWWTCTECHNPHTVEAHRYEPVKPEPPPALPRGMTSADHESGGY